MNKIIAFFAFVLAACVAQASNYVAKQGFLFDPTTGVMVGYINPTTGQEQLLTQGTTGINWYSLTGNGATGGTASFKAYCAANSLTCTGSSFAPNLQAFLRDVSTLRFQQSNSFQGFDNVFTSESSRIKAVVEPGVYKLGTTVVVPEGVDLVDRAMIYRDSTVTLSAPCTATNWDGSNCGNLSGNNGVYQPMLIVAPGGNISESNLYAKDGDGTHNGSGIAQGRVWEIGGIRAVKGTITGYTNGETCDIANPSGVGIVAKTTCTVSGGNLTAVAMKSAARWNIQNGVYTEPPMQQYTHYSQSAFIAATGVTTFNAEQSTATDPCYVLTGESSGASGACVTVSWWPDWTTGVAGGTNGSSYIAGSSSTVYEGVFSNHNAAALTNLGTLRIFGAGTTTDGTTYGPIYGLLMAGQNTSLDQLYSLGGYYPLYATATDQFIKTLNPVQSAYCAYFRSGQQHVDTAVCDSQTTGGIVADHYTAVNSLSIGSLQIFKNASDAALTDYAINLGCNSTATSSGIVGVQIGRAIVQNTGNTKEAICLDYSGGGNDINITAANFTGANAATTNQIAKLVNFGTHNTANAGNRINGTIDNALPPYYSGTMPYGTTLSVNGRNTQSHIEPVTGRYYTVAANAFSTVTSGATSGHAYVACVPVWVSDTAKPVKMAAEITTAPSATTVNFNLAIYTNVAGLPGTLLVDAGASGTGNIAVTTATTGVKIQAIQSGSQIILTPGIYWGCLQSSYASSGTQGVYRGMNNGSPGPVTNADFGWALTDASSSGTQVVAVAYTGPASALTAWPNRVDSWSAASYATTGPIVWFGY